MFSVNNYGRHCLTLLVGSARYRFGMLTASGEAAGRAGQAAGVPAPARVAGRVRLHGRG